MQISVLPSSNRRLVSAGLASALTIMLSGCAALPTSGPTGAQIQSASRTLDDGLTFPIVELANMAALPHDQRPPEIFQTDHTPPPTNLIGPGDVLDISIYEAGAKLFGGLSNAASSLQPATQVERLPSFRVDDQGNIQVPFAGTVSAAGRTTTQLEKAIETALHAMSENPQVLVSIRQAITNSVIVGGEVGKPGRLTLSTNRESLSDIVALAGGYRGAAKDLVARVERQGKDVEIRLSNVLTESGQDLRIYPGDRVTLMREPQTFSVMGAPGRPEQIAFSASSVSLAEAVALAGGTNPDLGDPKAIFIFRFIDHGLGKEKPVVYHLNMMHAGSYFIAQRFMMNDKDVLYFGNARANQPSKFVQIISQLFTPVILARQLTQ